MGLALVAVFLYAGSMSTSRDRRGPGRLVVRPDPAAVVRDLHDLDGRRDQPRAVRPPRGRGRAGRRLPHRVLLAEVRAVLPGRVHQHGHRLRARHDAVPRRLARAVVASTTSGPGANEGYWPLLWFFGKVLFFIFIFIWLRGSLPRLRYDQFMAFGWKRLIPISLVWIVAVATIRTVSLEGGIDRQYLLIGIGVARRAVPGAVLRRRRRRGGRRGGRDRRASRSRPTPAASRCRRCPPAAPCAAPPDR